MPGPVVAPLAAALLLGTAATTQEPGEEDTTVPETGIWFVHRHPSEPGWGKRVVRLPDASVLGFFRRTWHAAPAGDALHEWLRKQLGAEVYGLASLYQGIADRRVPAPKSIGDLQLVLDQLLYVEGDPIEQIRIDEHSLRVLTDNDDEELAYCWFDDAALRDHPDELAFVIHDELALPPDAATASSFAAPPHLPRLLPAGGNEGFTVAICTVVDATPWLSELAENPGVRIIEGLRLPELADYLRRVEPPAEERWPMPWLALRAMLGPQDELAGGLRALRGSWLSDFHRRGMEDIDLGQRHDLVHGAVAAVLGQAPRAPEPLIDTGEHHAVAFLGVDSGPMILFDDLWASAHPELARSMIDWARGWDPLDALHSEGLRHYVAARGHLPGQWFGEYLAELSIAGPAPDAMCVDGDRLWLASGRELRTLDLESGRLGEPLELPFGIRGIAIVDAVPHLLAAARDGDGCWTVHRLDPELGSTEAVFAVPAIEMAGTAIEPLGLALRQGRLHVHQTGAILELDASGTCVRLIGTIAGLQGLSTMGDTLVTRFESHLLAIDVTPRRASTSWIPLAAAPIAAAADDRGFVTLWPAGAGRWTLRRFRCGAPREHRVELRFVPEPGQDPDAASPAGSVQWTLDGTPVEDLADLRERLAALLASRESWPRDTLGEPAEPTLRIVADQRSAASDGDELTATAHAARSAGFDDFELEFEAK